METTFLPLSDPDLLPSDLEAVCDVLDTQTLSAGPVVETFEKEFAAYLDRKHAIAVVERNNRVADGVARQGNWTGR